MQLLKLKSTIKFMSARLYAAVFSVILVLASLTTLAINGLNWGLDFTGGTVVQVGYNQAADFVSREKPIGCRRLWRCNCSKLRF